MIIPSIFPNVNLIEFSVEKYISDGGLNVSIFINAEGPKFTTVTKTYEEIFCCPPHQVKLVSKWHEFLIIENKSSLGEVYQEEMIDNQIAIWLMPTHTPDRGHSYNHALDQIEKLVEISKIKSKVMELIEDYIKTAEVIEI